MSAKARDGIWQCTACGTIMESSSVDGLTPNGLWEWTDAPSRWSHHCNPIGSGSYSSSVRITKDELKEILAPRAPTPRQEFNDLVWGMAMSIQAGISGRNLALDSATIRDLSAALASLMSILPEGYEGVDP